MRVFRDLNPFARLGLILLSVVTLAAVVTASIPPLRDSVLRSAGWALVADDPPAKADIIVLSTDSLGAGILEAADLVHAGFATRVGIFLRPPTKVTLEFARRGVQAFDLQDMSVRLLNDLGITDIAIIPPVVGTVDEGFVLARWCSENSIHSVIFVSDPDHSRRTRWVLNRTVARRGIKVMVRYTRWGEFNPNSWWRNRGGQRTEAVESQKLLMELLAHPF